MDAPFTAPVLANVGGDMWVYATFTAPALANVGGAPWVYATFTAPALCARKLADDEEYQLWVIDGEYRAGCQRFTREEALEHWGSRTDYRARLFVAAIHAANKA